MNFLKLSILLIVTLLIAPFFYSFGQTDSTKKKYGRIDLSIGLNRQGYNPAISFAGITNLDADNRFFIGGGLRLNNRFFRGSNFKLRDKEQNTYPENFLTSGYIGSLNVFGAVEFRLFEKFGIGANIDVVGVSFGGVDNPSGQVIFSLRPNAKLEVSGFNLLLGPKDDMGSLNSEFYVFLIDSKFLDIRIGWSHYFNQLKVQDTEITYGSFSNLVFFATRFKI